MAASPSDGELPKKFLTGLCAANAHAARALAALLTLSPISKQFAPLFTSLNKDKGKGKEPEETLVPKPLLSLLEKENITSEEMASAKKWVESQIENLRIVKDVELSYAALILTLMLTQYCSLP